MKYVKDLPTFEGNILPAYSGWANQSAQMEAECFLETSVNIYTLHDIMFQKIVIVMFNAMAIPLPT
jgi:hypothetical protein